jgi:hypothetical protein
MQRGEASLTESARLELVTYCTEMNNILGKPLYVESSR